jgi:hypothetical protein
MSVSRSPGGSLYRARAWFRDFDGVRRMVERDARTEWAARTALEAALAERARRGAGSLRGSDTFAAAAALWLERLERLARLGQRSPGTVETYSRQLKGHVLPALGALRLQEVTTPLVDRFVTDVHEHVGPATGRTCRSIVSGVMALAVRHGAVPANPTRELERLSAWAAPRFPDG